MTFGRVVVYSFSFSHHGRYSSYHRLAHYLRPACRVIDASLRLPGWLPPHLAGMIHRRWFQASEWRLYSRFRSGQPHCFHYFYPENSMFHAAEWKGSHKLVLTCHQPAAFLERLAKEGGDRFLDKLAAADCLVLLAASTAEAYRRLAPNARIEVIPHGVDTNFFQPDHTRSGRPLIVTVGNWLRDYDCWAEVVRRISAQRADVEFAVVANPDTLATARRHLGECPARVRYLCGLSDEGLRQLYRESWIAFVPLTDAIANNAVLESLAMGLPLVVTDLPATREYAGDAALYFRNANPADCASRLLALLSDPARCSESGRLSRLRAESVFAWSRISEHHQRIYRELLTPEIPGGSNTAL